MELKFVTPSALFEDCLEKQNEIIKQEAREQQRRQEEAAYNKKVAARREEQQRFVENEVAARNAALEQWAPVMEKADRLGLSPQEVLDREARLQARGLVKPQVQAQEVVQARKEQGLLSTGKPAPVKEDIVRKHSRLREDGVREITLRPRKLREAPKGSRPVYEERPQAEPSQRGLKALKEHRPEEYKAWVAFKERQRQQRCAKAALAKKQQSEESRVFGMAKRILKATKQVKGFVEIDVTEDGSVEELGDARPAIEDLLTMSYEELVSQYRSIKADNAAQAQAFVQGKPKTHRSTPKRRDDAKGQTLKKRKRPAKGSSNKRGGQ